MKIQVVLVAAGSGTRFNSKTLKPFVLLKGRPLIAHSLNIFEHSAAVHGIIVVGHKLFLPRFEAAVRRFKKVRAVVAGGAARADSVKCGLAALDEDTDIVLVHDAARPLIDAALVNRLVGALVKSKAAIAAVPVTSTIKKVHPGTMRVIETPARNLLWEAQTPQGFHKDTLIKAHQKAGGSKHLTATDDAMLVERMGIKVKVVMGSYRNIKITTPEDLNIAANFLAGV